MAKKEPDNENRVICISRSAFFALIDAFVYDKITGRDLPDDYYPPTAYYKQEDGVTTDVWAHMKALSHDGRADNDMITLDYQNDTISRLHRLGYSYQVLDRRGDGNGDQLSLFDD